MRTPHERLQAFLYILVRDHLPTGVVDQIVQRYVAEEGDHLELSHCRPLVKDLASDWADRLIGTEEAEPEYRFGLFNQIGDSISMRTYETPLDAETMKPPWASVHRGRVVETTTTVANEIEWEDHPYGQ